MKTYSRSHLTDGVLLANLAARVSHDRIHTADLLADLAEVDARRLYLPAGHPSMYSYCVQVLRFSEDAAYKRIQAARLARQFPAIFEAVAEGRLHLSAVCLLSPYLTAGNAEELLKAAAYRTKSEIETLLAARFPRSEMLAMTQALPPSPPRPEEQLTPGQVGALTPDPAGAFTEQLAPGQVEAAAPRPKVAPVAAERFLWQFTVGRSAQEKLQYAQELLSHQVPSGEVAVVLERALDSLIHDLEKSRFAATSRPRPNPRRSRANPRHIPAEVKRTVWERDGGQCTFVGDHGHRCQARKFLEFDHIDPVARGGQATVSRMQLRCRAHNQYAAECAFGAEFMNHKREEAQRAAAAKAWAEATDEDPERSVIPWLRALGCRADEARRAAAQCETIPDDATLEQRVRFALSLFRPRGTTHCPAVRIPATAT